jgi:hypothetical protein
VEVRNTDKKVAASQKARSSYFFMDFNSGLGIRGMLWK